MTGHVQNFVAPDKFNDAAALPFSLRLTDFQSAMQDIYDLFHDINSLLLGRSLKRLEEMLRPAAMSGLISDLADGEPGEPLKGADRERVLQRPPRSHRGWRLPERQRPVRLRGHRDQIHPKEGGRGRHPRCA